MDMLITWYEFHEVIEQLEYTNYFYMVFVSYSTIESYFNWIMAIRGDLTQAVFKEINIGHVLSAYL